MALFKTQKEEDEAWESYIQTLHDDAEKECSDLGITPFKYLIECVGCAVDIYRREPTEANAKEMVEQILRSKINTYIRNLGNQAHY